MALGPLALQETRSMAKYIAGERMLGSVETELTGLNVNRRGVPAMRNSENNASFNF